MLKQMISTHPFNLEEFANSFSHGIGMVLSVLGLVLMVVFASLYTGVWQIVSVSIYCSTLVLLYTVSTVYHSVRSPKAKKLLRTLDHASIYLLIAGSYTPFMLVNFRGGWGWSIFGVIWGLAGLGVLFKIFFVNHVEWISILSYIVMGWLLVIAQTPIVEALHWNGFIWLLAGGGFYTIGVFFFSYRKIPFHHAIWHLFVLAGSTCHYYTILMYVLPV